MNFNLQNLELPMDNLSSQIGVSVNSDFEGIQKTYSHNHTSIFVSPTDGWKIEFVESELNFLRQDCMSKKMNKRKILYIYIYIYIYREREREPTLPHN